MAIGVGAVAAWGVAAAAAAGASAAVATAAGIAAAMVYGAVVGAVIGGLVSAVTGGDIGKGILYGAIGGAVTAGVSSAFSGAASGAASAGGGSVEAVGWAGSAGEASATGMSVGGAVPIGGSSIGAGAAGGSYMAPESTESWYSGIGDKLVDAGVDGAVKLTGAAMEGQAAQDRAEALAKAQADENEKARAQRMAELEATLASQEGIAGSNNDVRMKELEENRRQFATSMAETKRQFDIPLENAEIARKRSGGVLANLAAIRRGTLVGDHKSIREQVSEDSAEFLPAIPQIDSEGNIVSEEVVA